MTEDLVRIGEVLRSKRQELQLTLKEVENVTSIRSSYLEAIEDGQIQRYISGIYALGFIRQYGLFLGLEIEELIQQNPAILRLPSEKHDFSYGIGTLEVRGALGGGVRWLPNLLWIAVIGLILAAAWYLAKFLGVF